MTGSELLAHLKPFAKDAKYSQNLVRWLVRYKDWPVYVVFSEWSHLDGSEVEYDLALTQAHQVIICIGGRDSCDTGSRLSEILSRGRSAERWAFPIRSFKTVLLPDWFNGYIHGGKCFIDPQHLIYSDEARWDTKSKTRSCRWCGFTQRKITKRKTYHVWR